MGRVAPQTVAAESTTTAEIIFVGDIMMHAPQLLKAKRGSEYDFKNCFRYVSPIFKGADCVVANLETTLSESEPYTGYPRFCSPAALADALADAGVDVAVTANNHCLDAGAAGVVSTAKILAERGIRSVGATVANPLKINVKGIDFAILAYTYGTNGIPIPEGVSVPLIDTLQIASDLAKCQDADCRIAFMHWGEEYSRRASREQRQIADFLYRAGCQVVIGSHPHTVQPAECSKRRVTVYSLGNFISNQRMRYSDGGIMAHLTVEKGADGCQFWLNIEPVWVDARDYTVIPHSACRDHDFGAEYDLFMRDCERIVKNVR